MAKRAWVVAWMGFCTVLGGCSSGSDGEPAGPPTGAAGMMMTSPSTAAGSPAPGTGAPTMMGMPGVGAPTMPPAATTPPPAGTTPPDMGGAGSSAGGPAGGMAPEPTAGSPAGDAGTGMPPATSASLPPVETTDGPGPFTEVVKMKNVPPGGWLVYPKEIGKGGIKHPIFLWGPGGGTTPDTYDMMGMHYDRWVSHGFVVYSPARSTGNGTELKAGLDWLLKENDNPSSPVYQKLDTTKIAAAGHSQGSITTFAFATDPRLTTTMHISGGSFDGMGPDKLSKPTAYICGGADTLAMSNCSRDFTNTSKVPVYFALMDGVDHISAARQAWPAMIAWLRWHLAGEEKWKKEFLEPTGLFQTGKFKAMVKNW